MHTRRTILSLMAAAAALAVGGTAQAQSLAQSTGRLPLVTVYVGFPAGGATDTVARLVANAIQGSYADSVIVQNRAGAAGQIAAAHVKEQPANGTALLFTPAFPMAIFPHIYKELRYDTLKDFVPVATTHYGTLALAVGPGTPSEVKTLREFLAWARANPDKASFGAPSGSSQHFTGAMLARDSNVKLEQVAYRGGAPAVTEVLGGHLPAIITPLAELLPHAGALRILAVTSRERSVLAPTIPTFVEQGFANIVVQDWSGFLMPSGTPPELVARANQAISAAIQSPAVKEAMAKLGMEAQPTNPTAFAEAVRESWTRYRDIVQQTGFKAEP